MRWRRAPYNDPVPPGAASCHLQRSGGILHFGAEPLTTIGSHRARPAVIYNHLVKFCTSAPSHLQRSGHAGRGQLSFTMIRCNFAPRRQANYNNPVPPGAANCHRSRPRRFSSHATATRRRSSTCVAIKCGAKPELIVVLTISLFAKPSEDVDTNRVQALPGLNSSRPWA